MLFRPEIIIFARLKHRQSLAVKTPPSYDLGRTKRYNGGVEPGYVFVPIN
jgi:hypothetical protein